MTANNSAAVPGNIDDIKRGRRQRVEEGGKRTIIEEPGNRTIVQEKGGRAMIRHDEGERLRRTSRDVRTERRRDGGNLTIAIRPGGIEVFSEFDSSGRLQRRYRRGRDGRETNLIDNRRFRGARSGDRSTCGRRCCACRASATSSTTSGRPMRTSTMH